MQNCGWEEPNNCECRQLIRKVRNQAVSPPTGNPARYADGGSETLGSNAGSSSQPGQQTGQQGLPPPTAKEGGTSAHALPQQTDNQPPTFSLAPREPRLARRRCRALARDASSARRSSSLMLGTPAEKNGKRSRSSEAQRAAPLRSCLACLHEKACNYRHLLQRNIQQLLSTVRNKEAILSKLTLQEGVVGCRRRRRARAAGIGRRLAHLSVQHLLVLRLQWLDK